MASSGSGSGCPCGACKFLRRKCAPDCIFAPYFSSEQGAARFAAIHKVFGASNVSKLLLNIPPHDRCEAVVTIAYEAQARLRDPVYGCVPHIFALQHQVACLQAQLVQAKAQVAQTHAMMNVSVDNELVGNMSIASFPTYNPSYYMSSSVSSQSSLESVELKSADSMNYKMQEIESRSDDFQGYPRTRNRPCNSDMGELQALALTMMRN